MIIPGIVAAQALGAGGVGAQNLAPSLFTSAATFFAPTVGVGAVNLTPPLFASAQAFFTQIIVGGSISPTTWDPATVTAVTLSGGDLVATNTGTTSADQGAHAPASAGKTTSKYYFEATFTDRVGGNNFGVGIGTTASTYTNMGGSATTGDITFLSGSVWANGTNQSIPLGARVDGDVIGIAVDLTNRKIWFRLAPSGNWNNSGTANPATNVGGVTVPSGTMVPFVIFGGTSGVANNILTANFGGSAFTGAVPAGFTEGWPA